MITLSPIATVKNTRQLVEDDHWGEIVSVIELDLFIFRGSPASN